MQKKVSALLEAIFAKDDLASEVFVMRAEGFCPEDVQKRLAITPQDTKRQTGVILRKISRFITKNEHKHYDQWTHST